MSQVTEQSVRFQTALASIKLIQASAVLDLTEDDFDFLTSNKVWIATDRSRARRCVEACVYGTLDFVGYPRFPAPVEFIAAVIAYYVHPVNIQTACLIMEGAEFTENIINGVERPVKAAELFAFTLRVRAGNTDVLKVSMQISISSLQNHNVNRCGRSRHLARKLSLRRKRSSPNVFEMAATETITSIILIKLIRVSLGTVRHPRRFKIVVIDIQITLKQMLRDFIGIRVNRAKKSGMVNITSSVNSRERSGINTILHELNPLFTINVTMRDIKSKNVYSRVNSKATTQWRKTESANGVHLEG